LLKEVTASFAKTLLLFILGCNMVFGGRLALLGLASTCLLPKTQAARIARRRLHTDEAHRVIAGVEVQNHRAGAREWLVLFREGISEAELHSICDGRCGLVGHPARGGAAFAQVRGLGLLEALLRDHADKVELLEPDAVDEAIPELEDMEAQQFGSWGLEYVGVEQRATTGRGVHIYVTDTGVRVSHSDFEGRAAAAVDLTSGTLVECSRQDVGCALDLRGHGTHCAATAAGKSYGVASGAMVHAAKTLSDRGSGQRSWTLAAMDWVTTNGQRPAVISASLGGKGQDVAYTRVIGAATQAGVTVVVAAGNSREDACNFSPAFEPAAITVGATDAGNKRASYSNFGTCNDIMAPGTMIISAGVGSDTATRSLSGTSMACPHVSGAAALILEHSPSMSSEQIRETLLSRARMDHIQGLRSGDPDAFLWVGASPAPPSEPLQCPDFALFRNPDSTGDCMCNFGSFCSLDGGASKNCLSSNGVGTNAGLYFLATCTKCQCYSAAR